jgi:hypothetical protein
MLLLIEQMVRTIEGQLVEAQSLSIELFRVWSAAGLPEAVTYQGTTGVATRREQARLEQIIEGWSAFLAAYPRAASADATVAFALAETGDLDAAASRLEAASGNGFRDMPADAGWPIAVAMWSEVATMARDRASAAALYELLVAIDGLGVGTGGISLGPVARLLAGLETVLDRPEDADRHFADAIEQSHTLGSPVWIARSCLDWAEALVARGEHDRARELAADAETAMGSLGLTRLEQQAAALRERLAA